MSKKNKTDKHGFVYSTDPNFNFEEENEYTETLSPSQQKLKIKLDSKRRAGKIVTMIEGFTGKEKDIEELGKKLKAFCGTGGSAKNNEIIIRGDQREKVMEWLKKNGYIQIKKV